ncbi:hypothetical protein [Burkholderia gladioli]|uniref:hypothetical protein n=1 Tax=Burkholderia gladioli TaxID=28095 RepID=UPI00163F29A9|nr:hypothetical protein [Burkholderia gladioli]MDN7803153.1 hypothetical protein [Burkholderia gladioli]
MSISKGSVGAGRAERAEQAASLALLQLDLAHQVVNQWHPQNNSVDLVVEVAKIIATNHQTLATQK